MGTAYQPSGDYKIMSGNLTMKVGDQANLTVYDEKVDVYSELEQSESKVLMKIKNGEIIYRRIFLQFLRSEIISPQKSGRISKFCA